MKATILLEKLKDMLKRCSRLFVLVSIPVVLAVAISVVASPYVEDAEAKTVSVKRVQNVRVVQKTQKRITLKWKKQRGVNKYQVRVQNRKGKVLRKVSTKKRSHTLKKLKPGKKYTIRVRARKKKQWGKYSRVKRVRTKPVPEVVDEEEQSEEEQPQEDEVVEEEPAEEESEEEVAEEESSEEEVEPEVETGIPFGFWGLNGYLTEEGLQSVQTNFEASTFQVASAGPGYTVNTLLPLARDAGMTVTLRMTPGPNYNADFDLESWKDHIATWADSGVQEFINDGTLAGHMLLDDIHNFSYISGSTDPTAAELDEMARYSQEVMPGLMTFVREDATAMPTFEDDGPYQYLDAVLNQYATRKGDVQEYVSDNIATAEALGVGILQGLNIVDGGDGSSGQVGSISGKYAMTNEEIINYGEVMLSASDIQMFLLWEYDGEQEWVDSESSPTIGSDYFDQPEMQVAIKSLAEMVAAYRP